MATSRSKRTRPEQIDRTGSIGAPIPAAERRTELVALLTDMIPGAAHIRVTSYAPGSDRPHPRARALDANESLIPLPPSRSQAAAVWIMRAFPDVSWDRPWVLNLSTGRLESITGEAQHGRDDGLER